MNTKVTSKLQLSKGKKYLHWWWDLAITHIKNECVCKEKWTRIYNNYKQIWDFVIGMGHNEFFLIVYYK